MNQILMDLREILTQFYPDTSSIRRILDDSGIDSARIEFSSVRNSWHSILKEAEKTNQVEALLNVVEHEYGRNSKFLKIRTNYSKSLNKANSNNDKFAEQELLVNRLYSEQNVALTSNDNKLAIMGFEPGNSTYQDVLDKLGLPKQRGSNLNGNNILGYPSEGIYFLIIESPVKSNSIIDSVFIKQPYTQSVLYGLSINMTKFDAKVICKKYCGDIQEENEDSWICAYITSRKSYGTKLAFSRGKLNQIQYFVLQ